MSSAWQVECCQSCTRKLSKNEKQMEIIVISVDEIFFNCQGHLDKSIKIYLLQ